MTLSFGCPCLQPPGSGNTRTCHQPDCTVLGTEPRTSRRQLSTLPTEPPLPLIGFLKGLWCILESEDMWVPSCCGSHPGPGSSGGDSIVLMSESCHRGFTVLRTFTVVHSLDIQSLNLPGESVCRSGWCRHGPDFCSGILVDFGPCVSHL